MKRTFGGSILALFVFLAVISFFKTQGHDRWTAAIFLFLGSIGAAVVFESRRRVEYDDHGIKVFFPTGRSATHLWSEIIGLEYLQSSQSYLLKTTQATKIRISIHMEGFDPFLKRLTTKTNLNLPKGAPSSALDVSD